VVVFLLVVVIVRFFVVVVVTVVVVVVVVATVAVGLDWSVASFSTSSCSTGNSIISLIPP